MTWSQLIRELEKYPSEVLEGEVQVFADPEQLKELSVMCRDGFVPVLGVSPFDADEPDGVDNPLSLDVI